MKAARKGSDFAPNFDKTRFNFTFESNQNMITFLLDLSPYMLIYEYSTKSFPIQILIKIVQNLINVGLVEYTK